MDAKEQNICCVLIEQMLGISWNTSEDATEFLENSMRGSLEQRWKLEKEDKQ